VPALVQLAEHAAQLEELATSITGTTVNAAPPMMAQSSQDKPKVSKRFCRKGT
jgi:hypothetical protein